MGEWWEDTREVAQTVHVEEKPTWSGLYDANGRKLHKEPIPVGFDMTVKKPSWLQVEGRTILAGEGRLKAIAHIRGGKK